MIYLHSKNKTMKKLFILLFTIPFLISFSPLKTTEDFIGKWKGEDKGEIGFIIFDKDGYASIEIQGQIIGGKEFEIDGQKGSLIYKLNTSVEPIQIDFEMTKFKSGEIKSLLGIVEFIDDDSFKLALDFESNRPTDFSKNTITFQRVKTKVKQKKDNQKVD